MRLISVIEAGQSADFVRGWSVSGDLVEVETATGPIVT